MGSLYQREEPDGYSEKWRKILFSCVYKCSGNKEYGKKFYQREVYISDAINMAKESRYVLTGLVINAFTDSVILNWDQLAQEFLTPMRKKKPHIRDNNSDVKICVECYSSLCIIRIQ